MMSHCDSRNGDKMRITSLTDDNICNILLNLDVVQFIFLLTTCKQFYNMRKTALHFLTDESSYSNYDNKSRFITAFLNSYITHTTYSERYLQAGCKYDEKRIKNTLSIIGYKCTLDSKLHEIHKTNDQLLVLCCKAICRKFRYKYNQPYHRLYRLFWLNWHTCGISIWDLCELVYHIKNRKYKNVVTTLNSITYRESNTDYLFDTLSYIIAYIKNDQDNRYVAIIICLMYMYITENINNLNENIKLSSSFKEVIIEKAYEHIESVKAIDAYPKYLKEYIIDKFTIAIHYLA